ncbi:thermonuclease family protein [Thermaerobacter sp. PB12/4term]|uniref:thermonuclease family protein n=1 Tax=Thermaerobacter sp. PB12/4term TaxID=2293838 RepID=UPI001FACCACF|nr:thermonuclease family protein [Thermaerobacter sp. PB12/4term]
MDVKALSGARLPSTRVRLIGVDTPETTKVVEPYGREATAFTRKRLLGKTVYLEKDVSEKDRYGRALRYV